MPGEVEAQRVAQKRARSFHVPARLDDVLAKVLDGVEPRPQPTAPALPERYVLIDEIGRGAQSHVYAVFDRELNCKSALKVFNDGGGGRGHREAQALSGVEHENVVRVQDVGLLDGRVYLRMDFVDGTTLRRWVEGKPWRERLAAFIQAGRGLAAAHRAGIVHRDFKPDNALVRESDGRVVVVDFGLARGLLDLLDARTEAAPSASMSQAFLDPISRSGHLQGTPAYMAPEQFKREPIDARTDQFSFCVALYEALDGARPFDGKTIASVAEAVMAGKIKGPPRNAPAWVWRVLRRGLAVDPDRRYPSMDALLDDLQKDPRRWVFRLGLAAVAMLGVAGAWKLWEAQEERNAELQAQYEREREQRQNKEQELDERADALTLREVATQRETDPTRALAVLETLSPESPLWGAQARILAADAVHRGVAKTAVELGEEQVPHGLSPDGRIAVTREPATGLVRLYSVDDGTSRVLGQAKMGLPVVAFSPDGQFIAAQRVPDGVTEWDLGAIDGSRRRLGDAVDEHHRMIFGVGNPGVVTFGRSSVVIRWHGGQQILDGHEGGRVDAVAIDAQGSKAATVDGMQQLRLWDLHTLEARLLDGVAPVGFLADGRLLVTDRVDCDGRMQSAVRVGADRSDSKVLCTGADTPLHSLASSDDGTMVAASLVDGAVVVWNRATKERMRLRRADGEASELRFVGNDVLGSRSHDTTLVIWTLPSRRPHVLRGHVGVAHWARREDGTVVTFGHEGGIRTWELPARHDRALGEGEGPVTHVALAGEHLLTARSDGAVHLWPSGEEARLVVDRDEALVALAVAPDARRVALATAGGEVVLADTTSGEHDVLLDLDQVLSVAWSPDGSELVVAGSSGGVDVVGADSGDVRASLRAPDEYFVRGASFSPKGERITTVGWVEDGPVWIRRFVRATGEVELSVPLDVEGVEAVAFSGDGRYAVMSSFHREVFVWDASVGLKLFGHHDGEVKGIDISADGRRLVTAGADGVVKLWDLESGLHRTVDFGAPLSDVVFSADGEEFWAVGRVDVAFSGRDDLPHDPAGLRRFVASATSLSIDQGTNVTVVGLRGERGQRAVPALGGW